MLCQVVALSPPCCCESDKAVLSSALHRVFPGNNFSVLSWKRVVLSQGGEDKVVRYSPSLLPMLHKGWCNLRAASEFSSIIGIGINWHQQLGSDSAKSRRLKINSACLLSRFPSGRRHVQIISCFQGNTNLLIQ